MVLPHILNSRGGEGKIARLNYLNSGAPFDSGQFNDMRGLAEGLLRLGQAPLEPSLGGIFFRRSTGLGKSRPQGWLAFLVSILLLKWINPPGSTAIPLAAYLFTLFGRGFLPQVERAICELFRMPSGQHSASPAGRSRFILLLGVDLFRIDSHL